MVPDSEKRLGSAVAELRDLVVRRRARLAVLTRAGYTLLFLGWGEG